jgi:hypothetical protein
VCAGGEEGKDSCKVSFINYSLDFTVYFAYSAYVAKINFRYTFAFDHTCIRWAKI